MSGKDTRGVGELLLESDLAARAILMDVDEMDASTKLRTWVRLSRLPASSWKALPPVTPPEPITGEHRPDSADLVIQQLQVMSEPYPCGP